MIPSRSFSVKLKLIIVTLNLFEVRCLNLELDKSSSVELYNIRSREKPLRAATGPIRWNAFFDAPLEKVQLTYTRTDGNDKVHLVRVHSTSIQ